MEITYLGHAGFCIETESAIIIMDPWISEFGAFDAAWFQYPKNHHMSDFVQDKLQTTKKDKYLYISHEHNDHFDMSFLKTLKNRDFTILLADFVRPIVKDTLIKNNYACKNIILLKDKAQFLFADGSITLFVMDMELDCDSAILVKAESRTFLNLNDCKIHERLDAIVKEYGPIDVFAAQFSGAVWHPTCYKMDEEKYKIVCKNKMQRKFELIAKSLEIVQPAIYLPSAGPACFLDPELMYINFEEVNTYPRAPQLIKFLKDRFNDGEIKTRCPEIMPGDTLDGQTLEFSHLSSIRAEDQNFKDYIYSYAKQYEEFFKERQIQNMNVDPKQVFISLRDELNNKLARMRLVRKNIPIPLYFAISDYPDAMYHVDFQKNIVTTTSKIEADAFYSISTPAWQVNKVLTGKMKWSDFALTFRVTLERNPDIYNTLMHGFLTLNVESLDRFSELFFEIFSKNERINIQYKGKTCSVLRYCPHQGGDLLYGWVEDCFLVCPRHQWKFDLENHGACRYNDASVDAIFIDKKEDKEV